MIAPDDALHAAATALEPARPSAAARARSSHVFGPVTDFLCLGGGSLIVLALIALMPAQRFERELSILMMILANVLNHPHFAHSYQLFYRGFRSKAFGAGLPRSLRWRYLLAGALVPAMLAGYLGGSVLAGDPGMLGLAANAMALLVGWHYVKQGYGMLAVDAAFKRAFLDVTEKRVLVVNAYACWIAAWAHGNRAVADLDLWGIRYRTFDLPDPLYWTAVALACASSAAAAALLWRRWRAAGAPFPANGVVAYATSLYVWTLFIGVHPLFIFVVPAFHSLQYLLVVWRYRANLEASQADADAPPGMVPLRRAFGSLRRVRVATFVAAGAVLGFLGFWGIPLALDAAVDYDHGRFGSSLFLYVFWIFINLHHYFIDNVLWRRDNPETKRWLFGSA